MIKADNLSLMIGKKTIVRDIHFTARSGEILVLLGQNGSGKTTLLRTLSGILKAGSGDIWFGDTKMAEMKPSEIAKKVSYLPQSLPTPSLTVRELAEYGRTPFASLYGNLDEESRKIVEQSMEDAGVLPLKDRNVCHISGGERQMAYLAMHLAQGAEILLMDEPLANLDTHHRKRLKQVVREKKREGKTVILSLHDLEEAVEVGDHFLVLGKNAVQFDGNKEELLSSEVIREVFGKVPSFVTDEKGETFIVFRDI